MRWRSRTVRVVPGVFLCFLLQNSGTAFHLFFKYCIYFFLCVEVKILNCQTVAEAEKNMVFAARLTQRGHRIATMEDLLARYEKPFSGDTVGTIGGLPHPTVQKFAVITVAVVGASRRYTKTRYASPASLSGHAPAWYAVRPPLP
mgnify:CR=1 FL=1